MKNVICLLLCIFLFGVSVFSCGCAGREPDPIKTTLASDENLGCEALLMQKQQAIDEMNRLKPKTNKFVTNSIWFVVFPFLMDVKDAEKIEYNAYKRRADYLTTLMIDKNCVDIGEDVPEAITE